MLVPSWSGMRSVPRSWQHRPVLGRISAVRKGHGRPAGSIRVGNNISRWASPQQSSREINWLPVTGHGPTSKYPTIPRRKTLNVGPFFHE